MDCCLACVSSTIWITEDPGNCRVCQELRDGLPGQQADYGTLSMDFLPSPISKGEKNAILLDQQQAAGEEAAVAHCGQSGSPGGMRQLGGSITIVLNSFFIKDEPLAEGTPPETWSRSWRIGFLQESEICNQGDHLSFFLP